MSSDNIPTSFLCPITHNIMSNPYIDNEGNSYKYDNTQINFSQSFNCQDNGCFHGDTNIIMSDYTIKKIKDLKKGDKLLDKDNKISTVVCLIKIKCINNRCFLTEIKGIKNNLLITPYHPVIDIKYPEIINKNSINYNWVFPYTISMNSTFVDCDYIYNLVLDINHNIIAENTICVTLGHNFVSNYIISHSYFGTNKVIDDLSKMNGYNNGLIYLEGDYAVRDKNTGRIIRYKQE